MQSIRLPPSDPEIVRYELKYGFVRVRTRQRRSISDASAYRAQRARRPFRIGSPALGRTRRLRRHAVDTARAPQPDRKRRKSSSTDKVRQGLHPPQGHVLRSLQPISTAATKQRYLRPACAGPCFGRQSACAAATAGSGRAGKCSFFAASTCTCIRSAINDYTECRACSTWRAPAASASAVSR